MLDHNSAGGRAAELCAFTLKIMTCVIAISPVAEVLNGALYVENYDMLDCNVAGGIAAEWCALRRKS